MKSFTRFLPHLLFSSAIISAIIIPAFLNSSTYANQSNRTETKIPETVKNVAVRVEIHGVINGQEQIENGSGVIISRNGNYYTVLTAEHLLYSTPMPAKYAGYHPYFFEQNYRETYQGKLVIVVNNRSYEVTPENIYRLRNDRVVGLDLALIRFESNENYPVAKLALTAGIFDPVNVYGWPDPKKLSPQPKKYEDRYLTSTIYNLSTDYSGRSIARGYTMSYGSDLNVGGLSGGPVFDENGEFVIGIHGKGGDVRSEIPSIMNIFEEDKSLINRAAATPIDNFLDQLLPNYPQYNRDSLIAKINPQWLTGINNSKTSAQANSSINKNTEARQNYRDAVRSMRGKNFSDAINFLQKAVTPKPDDAIAYLAYLALGDAYYQNAENGNIDQKKKAKKKAFAQYQEAEKILNKNKEDKTDIILRKLAILYRMKKDENDDENDRDMKIELNKLKASSDERGSLPLSITYYINQALIDKNKSDAKTSLSKALEMVQKKVIKNKKLLEKLLENKEGSENLKQFAYIERSMNAFYLVAIGKEYYKAHFLETGKEEALKIFDEAIDINPNEESTYLAIITFLIEQNQETALGYLQRLQKQNFNNPEILRTIAGIYENNFQLPEQAIIIAEKLASEYPENPEVHFEAGLLLEKNNKKEKAVEYFKKALVLFINIKDPYGISYANRKLCFLSPKDNRESCSTTSLAPKKPPTVNPLPTKKMIPTTPESTFSCDPKTSNLTLRTTNGKQRILINWQSTAFTPSGYNPQIRCKHISARLEKFQKENRLNPENITSSVRTYKIKTDRGSIPYTLNILCLAKSSSDAAAKKCAEDGLIITLERSEKPEQILKQFREALSQEFAGEPLTKDIDKQKNKPTSENQK
ncbi:MAG: COP23 domain-containing protein [Nostoc sp.]|uniref:COP23 domain-containing protein n=1 Tax=Nostoc sp. TaxID=1180 RepID=UPI002FF84426